MLIKKDRKFLHSVHFFSESKVCVCVMMTASGFYIEQDEDRIERPIAFVGEIRFLPDNAIDVERAKSSWPFLPIFRLWSFGLKKEELVKWFDSIPNEIVSVLQRMLSLMHADLIKRASHTQTIRGTNHMSADDPFRSVEECDDMGDFFESEGRAYVRVEYEAATQERKHACANKMNSFVEHMHREEYLARMANHELSIPMPSFDFLCFSMNDVLQYSEHRLERYFRLCKLSSATGGAMLIHSTTIRSYNSAGQISKATAPWQILQRVTFAIARKKCRPECGRGFGTPPPFSRFACLGCCAPCLRRSSSS